ncbi:hypothetical protein BS47DRAFT_1396805 [Hydnum rufescens UP504]|uniref:Uncharacterized protein n=1 Tax=Hydnum rufescens UP504 TaxID=1448309 RepID=A0A9P6AP54_9AGAM|nr:hypothetical protein BS47DRAFT_1396805 [Hydnum rufescens UP504]
MRNARIAAQTGEPEMKIPCGTSTVDLGWHCRKQMPTELHPSDVLALRASSGTLIKTITSSTSHRLYPVREHGSQQYSHGTTARFMLLPPVVHHTPVALPCLILVPPLLAPLPVRSSSCFFPLLAIPSRGPSTMPFSPFPPHFPPRIPPHQSSSIPSSFPPISK